MAKKTQESQCYYIDPTATPAEVVELVGVTDIQDIDAPISSVDTTTLASDHREFIPGIAEPATATITMNAESDDSQSTLHALLNAGTTLQWALGDSDGTVAPSLDSVDTTKFSKTAVAREFTYFEGFPTSWKVAYGVNGVKQIVVGLQLTNRVQIVPKV